MRVAVGSDYRGSAVKRNVIELGRRLGHEVQDFGAVVGAEHHEAQWPATVSNV